ncbi:hypothetical protein F383_16614 [Gossypium arboreum]|uniref:BTB domain-containing protein n=1 Tax=Gossypium arboreum TaxID=29729 RepID=A0A0B0NNP9_GOSAR|nr:hypothetical protein F383_16614 [Gossypium arboreum]
MKCFLLNYSALHLLPAPEQAYSVQHSPLDPLHQLQAFLEQLILLGLGFEILPNHHPVEGISLLDSLFSFFAYISAKSTVTTPVNEKPLTDTEDDLIKRISFLSGFMMAFKDQIHTDIKLKPNNGPCISAHKSLLAARSEIFKNILNSDDCKAPPTDTDTITLSELSTEELKSFLEFLYTGDLPADKFKKHVYALYVAADKYEIPYLQESCERYMLNSLNASNALDTLDISNLHSKKKLKETTLNFIVRNMKSIVSSQKYEEFASSNPHLSVEVTRAFVEAKF